MTNPSKFLKKMINYNLELVRYIYDISEYAIIGALCSLILLCIWGILAGLQLESLGFYEYGAALAGGALMGLIFKTVMMFAMEAVMRASAANVKLNVKRAKALGLRLKMETKDKVQASVIKHAREIIFQMNGTQSEEQLAGFLATKMAVMRSDPDLKIDRHLSYLTDRAIHGDLQSLKRLYQLYRRTPEDRAKQVSAMIDRIINNPREVQKLKDKIDTLYDKWKFRQLSTCYAAD